MNKKEADQFRDIVRAEIRSEVAASEGRMSEKIQASETSMTGKIQESEKRLKGFVRSEVSASETRMIGQIKASEGRMTERLGSQIDDLAEGQQFIIEKVSQVTTDHEQRIQRLEKTIDITVS